MQTELQARRRLARISQIRLCREANVSRTRVSLAENGLLELRPEEVTKLREAIDRLVEKAQHAYARLK